MRKRLTAIAALLGVLLLSGCGDDQPRKSNIELGKECFAAGGSWTWSDWAGYTCEFIQGIGN